MRPERIMVVGQPGAGKSTLAAALAEGLGLLLVCTDVVRFRPGWIARRREDWMARMRAEEAREAWVIEGGLPATWQTRAGRADLIVWVDRPVGLRLRRILGRLWRYRGRERPELGPGYERGFRLATLRQLWSVWRARQSGRERIAAMVAAEAGKSLRLASDADTRRWLKSLGIAAPGEWG